MILTGQVITSKEYPVKHDRQYFEAVIYEPHEQHPHGKDIKGEMVFQPKWGGGPPLWSKSTSIR
jgi:hypothetical protein